MKKTVLFIILGLVTVFCICLGTIIHMGGVAKVFNKGYSISFEDLDYDTLSGYFEWILTERKCSETTRNQRLAALLSFSKYAQNRDFDAAAVFRNSIIRIPLSKPRGKRRTWFTAEEMKILLALPDDRTSIGLRDKMILTTLYVTGARSQELCDLTVSCVRKKKDRTAIELNGKGDKSRLVNVSEAYAIMLDSYLRKRRIHGISDRHIFSSQTHEHMTISCVEEIVKKYVRKAKEQHPNLFTMGTYTPHSFRHSTATHMLEAGVPLMAIKKFLGHASIQTTQVYYGKKNLMTSCTGRCRDLLKHLPEQLFIINASVH